MTYHTPTDLNEALALLDTGPFSVVAGGTDFFPSRHPGPVPNGILDVSKIDGLRGITQNQGSVRIGGATRWSDIAKADLPPCFDGLRHAAREVGSLQIQNAGTIAGNICNASPAADGVPPLVTLDARVELCSTAGTRQLPLGDFLTGVRQTQLQPIELVTALHIALPPPQTRGAFTKLGSRRYLVISVSMVAVIIGCNPLGQITFARVAVGACSPVAQRLQKLEQDLIGAKPSEITVGPSHLACLSPVNDIRGSKEFRTEAVAEQIRRVVIKAAQSDG